MLKVLGLSGMRVNFLGAKNNIQKEITKISDKHGRTVVAIAQQLVPVDSGLTKRSIKYLVSEGGLTVQIFSDSADYEAEGEPYYAPDVEFGTYKSPAQPFLFPASEADKPAYKRDVANAVQRALNRVKIR